MSRDPQFLVAARFRGENDCLQVYQSDHML